MFVGTENLVSISEDPARDFRKSKDAAESMNLY